MKTRLEIIDSILIKENKGLVSSFSKDCDFGKIELNYKYIGEPNYGRIQLALEFRINGIDESSRFSINKSIELPYQYPKEFDLTDASASIIAIPHNSGVFLINRSNENRHLVKYQSKDYLYSYFIDDFFILVESKFITLFSLLDSSSQIIHLGHSQRRFINGVQVNNKNILVVLRNVDLNNCQLLVYDRVNFNSDSCTEVNLSEVLKDEFITPFLKYEKSSILSAIPDFKYNSIVDSWRYIPTYSTNRLIALVEKWENPILKGEYYNRIEKYGYVELFIE